MLLCLWWYCLVQVLQGTAVWDIEIQGTAVWDIEVWGTAVWDIEVWSTVGWDIEVWGTAGPGRTQHANQAKHYLELLKFCGHTLIYKNYILLQLFSVDIIYKIDYKFFTFTKIHNSHNTAEHITI